MSDYGWGMFKKGLKRRKKEVRRMRVMTCLAVFFLAFSLLLQDNLGALQMELNYRNYGRWFAFDDDDVFTRYPYLVKNGEAYVGSYVYSLYPASFSRSEGSVNDLAPLIDTVDENGEHINEKPPITDDRGNYLPPAEEIIVENFGDRRTTNCHIGAYSEGFIEENGIRLYEGSLPQADDEIVMELGVLHALGVSYELGQDISFYVSETEPLFKHEENNGNSGTERPSEDYYLKLHLVTFRLVGTLERYTARWNSGANLPGAIITNEALKNLPSFRNKYQFYELKEGIGGDKVWEFAAGSFEGFENWRSGLYQRLDLKPNEKGPVEAWNSYAYTNPLWGSSGVYRYVSIILMVMSTCILAYLMASYLSKRRRFFMRMREIGATSGEVWRMSAYECVISALPYAAASLAESYLIAFLASVILSKTLNIEAVFKASPKTLLVIVSSVLLMLAVSLAAAFAIYSGRGIAEKKRSLSKSSAKALRERSMKRQKHGKRYLSLIETLKRLRRISPLKTALVRIACILIGAMILLSFMQVYAQTYCYLQIKNAESDLNGSFTDAFKRDTYGMVDTEPHWNVTGSKKTDHDKADLSISMPEYSYSNLLGEEFFGELESIPGIKNVIRGAIDSAHTLSWEGKWTDDGFIDECIDMGIDAASDRLGYKLIHNGNNYEKMRRYVDNSLYMLQCCDNTDAVWKAAKPYLCAEADKTAFLRGEQAIIFVDENLYCVNAASNESSGEYMLREEFAAAGENVWKRSPSFSAGDTVYINNMKQDGRQTPVKVAAVLPMTEYVENEICGIYSDSYYPVFVTVGSMALAEKVQETDDIEFGANVFGIKLDSIAESENTLKFVSALCVRDNVKYNDTVEIQIESQNYWIDVLLTYGFFTVILLVLYVFIFSSIAREDRALLTEKYRVLHRAGMSMGQLKTQKKLDALIQSLWQLLSVPLFALIFFAPNLLKLGENASARNISKWQYVMVLVKTWFTRETTDQRAIACVMLVLMLILCVINSRITHSSEKQI